MENHNIDCRVVQPEYEATTIFVIDLLNKFIKSTKDHFFWWSENLNKRLTSLLEDGV